MGMDLACGDIYKSVGMGEVLWQISRKGYLDVVDTIICVIFSHGRWRFILAAILWMMKKRQETFENRRAAFLCG